MQNIVTKCPKRGLETRIYLVLRNNFVFGRERKKSHRQNVCKKIEVWISLKQCIWFRPILEIWIQALWLVFKNHPLGGRGPLEFVIICCHFISIIWVPKLPATTQAVCYTYSSITIGKGDQNSKVSTLSPSSEQLLYFRSRGWWRGQPQLKISEPKTSGWIGKCVSIKKNRGQSKTEKENK